MSIQGRPYPFAHLHTAAVAYPLASAASRAILSVMPQPTSVRVSPGTAPGTAEPRRGPATRFRLHAGVDVEPRLAEIDDSLVRRPRVQIAPGRIIPGTRYRATRWLGEGGMGVVYEAEHVDIGRRVAVKILRQHYSDDPDAIDLFRQEARATAQVGSDNILQVHDFAQLPDGRLMMAMELLEGHDLMSEMGQPLDPARVVAIARQCCRALQAAHQAGLVHRDIKPENIFILDGGERPGKVKLVDFGIAVMLSGDKTKRNLVGTPQYIAPEAISSSEVGPKLDQYALGVVMYEMLTGTTAFEADSVASIIQAQLNEMPYPPSQVVPSVPAAFDAVVMRCLAKHPHERFADMRDLEAAICEAQIRAGLVTEWDDLPLPDVEPERRAWLLQNMPTGAMAPRKRSPLALVLSLVGAVVLGGVVTAVLLGRTQAEAAEKTIVDELAEVARAAASRGQWVHPPRADPEAMTSYQAVLELEALEREEGAGEMAQELRREFATMLKDLGDTYWDRDDGGPMVAEQFYRQALLFDTTIEIPEDRRTDERSLQALTKQARYGVFSADEVAVAQALSALADTEPARASANLREAEAVLSRKQREDQTILRTVTAVTGQPKPARSSEAGAPADAATAEPAEPAESAAAQDARVTSRSSATYEPLVREQRDPKRARSLAREGMVAFRRGDYAQATLLFDQALAKNPNDQLALTGMRDAYFDSGDYGRASRYGRTLVNLSPRDPDHRLRLGDAYFKVGRNGQAEKEYKKALELGDTRAKERLERVRLRLGK
jgi:tetratricopeptide (TPR) repeat protein